LSMEPLRLVKGKPPELGSEETHKVSAHGQENHHGINGEDKAGPSRYPY
jgi:hypothetical protein